MSTKENAGGPNEIAEVVKQAGPLVATITMTGRNVHATILPLMDGFPKEALYAGEEYLCKNVAPVWFELLKVCGIEVQEKGFTLVTDHEEETP